jgi:hypothetical protein
MTCLAGSGGDPAVRWISSLRQPDTLIPASAEQLAGRQRCPRCRPFSFFRDGGICVLYLFSLPHPRERGVERWPASQSREVRVYQDEDDIAESRIHRALQNLDRLGFAAKQRQHARVLHRQLANRRVALTQKPNGDSVLSGARRQRNALQADEGIT